MQNPTRPTPLPPLQLLPLLPLLLAAALVFAGPVACSSVAPESSAARDARLALARLAYPADAQRGPDLDIAAERHAETLTLLNRTARVYRDQQLWLNRQYVNHIPALQIGAGNRLHLPHFINRYAEPFPVATPLVPDKARAVVLVELYDPKNNLITPLTLFPDATQGSTR